MYYTLQEAERIKNLFAAYIGKEMVYSINEAPVKVSEIQIQESGREINYQGEIENGYYVAIFFDGRPALMPVAFCSVNNIEPYYATHRELDHGTRNQIVTRKTMNGNWEYKNGSDWLNVSVDDLITVQGEMNGSIESYSFSSAGFWTTPYSYQFTDNHDFVISSADAFKLKLLKLAIPGNINGNYKFRAELTRV